MIERSKAEKLAHTLRYLVEQGIVPGLLPKSVIEAAELLCEQEKQLKLANAALTAKGHIVRVSVRDEGYRKAILGTFIIIDPRIYFGEMSVAAHEIERGDERWVQYASRHLASTAMADWRRDIEEKTYIAFRKALRDSDTRPKDGDAKQAPLAGSAAIAQTQSEN